MAVRAQDGHEAAVRTALACCVFLLGACAGGPLPPDWQVQSHASLEKFTQHYLEGNTRMAQRSFAQLQAAVAATGRLELAARAELARCALGVAALDAEACATYQSMRGDATAEDRVYGDFVAGELLTQDARRLPDRYRRVATAGDDAARNKAMQQIDDPVSRLVAAGVLFRRAQLSPEGLASAIDTASAAGYRRALLAYLQVQARRADAAGDSGAAQSIRRRIDLVGQSLPK